MNILFLGTYRQADGWGYASYDYLQALKTTSHNITARPIFLGKNLRSDLPDDIIRMEEKTYSSYDLIIQNTLPQYFEYTNTPRSLGLFFIEVKSGPFFVWKRYIDLMDECWLSSQLEINYLRNAGVSTKLTKINMPIDTSIFKQAYKPLPGIPQDTFNFYFIGEYTHRKDIMALIVAFQREFRSDEPVELIIKTSGNLENIRKDMENLKYTLKLYSQQYCYKEEKVITHFLSQEEMCQLHTACDCFVIPSSGEACCRPAMEAMGFGNTPIVNKNTGMTEFVTDKTGYLVNSYETPILSPSSPISELYDGKSTWFKIDIIDLQKKMRMAYQNQSHKQIKAKLGKKKIMDFDYKKIGEQIKNIL